MVSRIDSITNKSQQRMVTRLSHRWPNKTGAHGNIQDRRKPFRPSWPPSRTPHAPPGSGHITCQTSSLLTPQTINYRFDFFESSVVNMHNVMVSTNACTSWIVDNLTKHMQLDISVNCCTHKYIKGIKPLSRLHEGRMHSQLLFYSKPITICNCSGLQIHS